MQVEEVPSIIFLKHLAAKTLVDQRGSMNALPRGWLPSPGMANSASSEGSSSKSLEALSAEDGAVTFKSSPELSSAPMLSTSRHNINQDFKFVVATAWRMEVKVSWTFEMTLASVSLSSMENSSPGAPAPSDKNEVFKLIIRILRSIKARILTNLPRSSIWPT